MARRARSRHGFYFYWCETCKKLSRQVRKLNHNGTLKNKRQRPPSLGVLKCCLEVTMNGGNGVKSTARQWRVSRVRIGTRASGWRLESRHVGTTRADLPAEAAR